MPYLKLAERHELERPGATLTWWDSVPGDGKPGLSPVVFTHGGAMDRHLWDGQVAEAFTRGHRCVTHDLRGHGESSCGGSDFSIDACADDVLAIMDAAGIDSAVLVGHSVGASVAQMAALRAPDRVSGLVGVGCCCITLPFGLGARMRGAANPMALRVLGQSRVRAMFAEQAGVKPETQAYAAKALGNVSDEVFAAVMRVGFGARVQVPDGYHLGVPLLILQGEREPNPMFMANVPAWCERDEGRLVTVQGAAHNVNQDQPDVVNAELGGFLASLSS